MIVAIHGITGNDNHSAVVGAVEAENVGSVKMALRRFNMTYGKGQLNRRLFNQFAVDANFKIVPMATLDYDQV